MTKSSMFGVGALTLVVIAAGIWTARSPITAVPPDQKIEISTSTQETEPQDETRVIARIASYEFTLRRTIAELGGMNPEVANDYEAKDRESGKPILATDLFSEEAIVTAFVGAIHDEDYASDPQTASTFQKLKASKSTKELEQHLAALGVSLAISGGEECDGEAFTFDPRTTNFAIVGFDEMANKAAVHFGVSVTPHVCNAIFPRLRLDLEVPPALKTPLMEAARGKQGFLVQPDSLKTCDTCTPVDFTTISFNGG